MNRFRLPFTIACIILISTIGWGQIHLKLEETSTANTYGVYVMACENISPTGNTITGSGQITIVHPHGQTFSDFVSVSGLWQQNAEVLAPIEAPNLDYVSVGFVMDHPQIIYQNDEPTLLFTFKLEGGTGGVPYLIDNQSDPFAQLPNSLNTNPGNELTTIDFGVSPAEIYSYAGNYLENSINCDEITEPDPPVNSDTTIVVIDTTQATIGGEDPAPDDDEPIVSSTLEDLTQDGYFILTPNPTSEWLNVIFNDESIEKRGTLRFWSVNGIALGELKKGQQEKMTLNVGALPDGLYFLSFEAEGEVLQRERFLKQ